MFVYVFIDTTYIDTTMIITIILLVLIYGTDVVCQNFFFLILETLFT